MPHFVPLTPHDDDHDAALNSIIIHCPRPSDVVLLGALPAPGGQADVAHAYRTCHPERQQALQAHAAGALDGAAGPFAASSAPSAVEAARPPRCPLQTCPPAFMYRAMHACVHACIMNECPHQNQPSQDILSNIFSSNRVVD